jgi:uncharacterized protein (TIGR02145 family)
MPVDPKKQTRAIKLDAAGKEKRPAGYFQSNRKFYGIGNVSAFWTATAFDENKAWLFKLLKSENKLWRQKSRKFGGYSCRCVRDLST